MGESAGGNLAINVAIKARDAGGPAPVHQVLVYPVAGIDMNTPSYRENEDAKPLNKAMMGWFMDQVLAKPEDKNSPLLNVVGAADLARLPPATLVTAEIDPLRSEGQLLAQRLEQAGVPTEAKNYEGVTHEFFGMGAVVADAKQAQAFVAQRLTQAFEAGGDKPR
jgi:acetyl esterase